MSYGETFKKLAIAAVLGFGLVACGGGGGGGSSTTGGGGGGGTTSTTTTTTVTTTAGSSAVTATAVNTSATAVAGTGTAGTATTTTLAMADKISVVGSSSVKPTKAPKGISTSSSSLWARLIPTSWAPTADWFVDPQFVYVHERSEEAFAKSNEILCMIGQTEWEAMTNQGAYLALIDQNKCSTNRDNAQSAGQSSQDTNTASNANAPSYQNWVMMSKRADATTAIPNPPQVISAWIDGNVGGGPGSNGVPGRIYAKVIVQDKPSTANPYGFFYMSFLAHPYQTGSTTVVDTTKTLMSGYMRTVKLDSGEVVLQFYNGNDITIDPSMMTGGGTAGGGTAGSGSTISATFAERSTLSKTATGGGGEVSFPDESAFMTAIQTAMTSGATTVTVPYKEMRFAHDGTSFQREEIDPSTGNLKSGTSPICLDTAQKVSTAWRYAAYRAVADSTHAAGSRISLNTGFPVIYNDGTNGTGGTDHEGWMGNWGLWLNDGTTVPDGSTINKYDYQTKAKTPYTYRSTGGKLTKHTKVSLTLSDIKNIPLQVGIGTTDPATNTYTFNQYEVSWNGTGIVLKKKLDQTTWMWTDLTLTSTPVLDTPVTVNQWDRSFNFWSQSLNGSGRVELNLCTKTDVNVWTAGVTTAAGYYSNCSATGNIKGSLNTGTQAITPYITAANKVTFNKEQVVFMNDATNAPATALACTENCPSGDNIAKFNDSTVTTKPTTVEYADSGWSQWPNLSNINQQLSPANWQHCPNKATDGTGVCSTPGQTDWSKPWCTGPASQASNWNPTAAAGETAGVTCHGWNGTTMAYVTSAGSNGGFYKYTFDAATYVLTDTGANLGAGRSTALLSTANQWANSGLLFDPLTTGNFTWTDWNGTQHTNRPFAEAIQCDWPFDPGNGSWGPDPSNTNNWIFTAGTTTKYGTCTWRLWDTLNVYYTWETGSDWNTLKLLTDSNGKAVTFDEPLILDYIHGAAGISNGVAIDNTGLTGGPATTDQWYGSRMALQYGGFGDLWGIPGHCVDMDTGSDKSCDMNSRWVPAFTIPDESAATYVDSTGTTQTVYIKALEKEERMTPLSSCTATLTAYSLPPSTDYVAPDIGSIPTAATNPSDPIASGAPSVVGGVVQ